MSARRRARVVRLSPPAPADRPLESMLMEEPESGLRVLLLALHGLEVASQTFSLDSETVQREVVPLIALTYDIQASLERVRARMRSAVDARGGEA